MRRPGAVDAGRFDPGRAVTRAIGAPDSRGYRARNTTAASPSGRVPPGIVLGPWEPISLAAEHTAVGSGVLVTTDSVAVSGATGLDGAPFHGAVWLSMGDGTWREVPASRGWSRVYLADLASAPGGYIAAGPRVLDEIMDPTSGLRVTIEGSVWRSADLQHWTEVQRLPGTDPAWVRSGGGTWVVAGGDAPDGAGGCWHGCASGVSIWWSADGERWDAAVEEPDPAYRLAGLAWSKAAGWLAIARVRNRRRSHEDGRDLAFRRWRALDTRR